MLFHNKRLYAACEEGKMGRWCPEGPLASLRTELEQLYSISVVYLTLDKIDIGPHTGRDRLSVYTDTEDMAQCISSDDAYESIQKLAEQRLGSSNPHVYSESFQNEAMNQAAISMRDECGESLAADIGRGCIWQITGMDRHTTVFMFSDADVKSPKLEGVRASLRSAILEAIQAYDVHRYFTSQNLHVGFDSKERLDRDFNGNMFNYFR